MPWRENKGVANLDGFKRIFLFHAYAHPFNLTQIIDDYIIHLMTTIGRDA